MSKESKKPISFEEAVRLAMKTKPPRTIKLLLDQKTEVPNVAGFTVVLTIIEILNQIVADYYIEFEIFSSRSQLKITNNIRLNPILSKDDFDASTRVIKENNRFTLDPNMNLYLTLKCDKDAPDVKSAKITYSVV